MLRPLLPVALALTLAGCPYTPVAEAVRHQPDPMAPALADEIVLLNWNIFKQVNNPEWQQEFRSLHAQFQPDLITLQEANLGPAHLAVAERHGYVFGPNLVLDEKQRSGVLTAANVNPSRYQTFLSDAREPLLSTAKVFVLTEYPIEQREETLMVVNIHAINFVSATTYNTQLFQLEQAVREHQGPLILSGDFNSWSGARQRQLTAMATSLGLQPVDFGDKLSATFMGQPLDHVLYSPHLEADLAWIGHEFESSDHYPMVVRFRIRDDAQQAQ
ncbi:endonuclease/exonuclease/phosphatase family protein [Ferrimonas marina]|uniref:Uncharacterized conserved protein YafD, endonuclease/exonuclease/phosphatase (EEP) superfamily n=1 Tax=Ferrimonas marina TaxID=299255 RepID=A0A1M5Z4E4_9GAMM|nr:endonuclease/exonuclease/phosphatase family protein [Ferrimonas marina]SHI19004.1 Uncharacterized conserved protein YafD, endonuclease/exonuclease/phosphatase (EEP) superfamily [Ferrimonas marina]